MATVPTRDRILDAAEELFAEQGFASSLRNITSNAGVNLAAVNYHFGSKEALIEELFARRIGPLNEERLELLARADGLEEIVEAFVGPALRMSHDPRGAIFMRLFGHTMSQRDDRILRMFTDQFRVIVERFSAALARALPHVEREEILWRILFMVGSMAHTMALSDKFPSISGGVCQAADVETTLRRLVPFLAGGMRAAAPTRNSGGAV